MKIKTIYYCEYNGCQFCSEDAAVVQEHEFLHIGITAAQYQTWLMLQKEMIRAAQEIYYTHNAETLEAEDIATKKFITYENGLNLSSSAKSFLYAIN